MKSTLCNTYNVKMLLAADIHGIKADYGTWKSWKSDIKLHFQIEKMKSINYSHITAEMYQSTKKDN